MIGRVVLALALGLAAASAALAQTPDPTRTPTVAPAPAPAPVKTDPDLEIVCKRVDVSGTRIQLPKKCMTRKDWASMTGRGKEDMDAAIRAGLARNAVGGS